MAVSKLKRLKNDERSEPQKKVTLVLLRGFALFLLATSASTFLPAFWLLDVLAELTTVWVWISVLAMLVAFRRRDLWSRGLAVLSTTLFVAAIVSSLQGAPKQASGVGRRLTILQANVLKHASNADAVTAEIEAQEPDIVCLYEFSPQHEPVIAKVAKRLPFVSRAPYRQGMAMVILSRFPIESGKSPSGALWRLNVEGQSLTVYSIHPPIPKSATAWNDRDRILRSVALRASQVQGARVIIGDLNATPFAHVFSEVESVSGMRDSARGRGLFTSWPTFGPTFISLDHLLVSPEVRVAGKWKGNRIGSDHVPVVTVIEF